MRNKLVFEILIVLKIWCFIWFDMKKKALRKAIFDVLPQKIIRIYGIIFVKHLVAASNL